MAKRLLVIFSLLFSHIISFSQVSIGFADSFSDGDFSANPIWSGETAKFIVNTSNQLQLNDLTASSPAYLATSSAVLYKGSWEFYVHLDFAPSGSNYTRVYLVSDQQDLLGSLNGYFVQIGGVSGTVDDVSLFRQDGISSQKIIDGLDGTAGNDPVDLKVLVERDSIGNWELYIDLSATGSSYVSQGFVNDNFHMNSQYFGLRCDYTSTRSDKFFFDDFVVQGELVQDTIKPELNSVSILSDSSLQLQFSEKIEAASGLMGQNYSVNGGIGNPTLVSYVGVDSSQLRLDFANHFSNGTNYQIQVQNLKDGAQNIMIPDSASFFYFVAEIPAFRNVVINEAMVDFSPQVALPEVEFVEIFNASNKYFDLQGWTLSDQTSTATLGSRVFAPGDYLILCPAGSENQFSSYGQVMGVSGFPSYNNSGDIILLKDDLGFEIDQIEYDLSWYNNDDKSDGGYTLEQINPFKPCSGAFNFGASNSSTGGSPGQQNSIFSSLPDSIAPVLIKVFQMSADSIHLQFSEAIDPASLSGSNISLSNGTAILSKTLLEPSREILSLKLQNNLDTGIQVKVQVSGLSDCEGNIISGAEADLFIPFLPEANDLIINEVLFNPKSGGSDFVEIYNRSDKILDLKDLRVANFVGDSIATPKLISAVSLLIFPEEYAVITEDKNYLIGAYPGAVANRIFKIADLPSYNDDEGRVYLLDAKKKIIDYFAYSDDMHFDLLNDDEGVSLERLDPNRNTNEEGNFQSASETVGFATPGYQNSQYFASANFDGKVSLDPELFSPDNDGFQDVMNINYLLDKPGFIANLRIYDNQGRLIRVIAQNKLLGTKGSFTWDGIRDNGEKASVGVYLVFFELFTESGEKQVYKKACVLATKL